MSVALLAGGLAVFNPCGFPVLTAFLAYNLGAGGERLRGPGQAVRGLGTGLLVAAGFLGVFTVIGLPLSYGLGAVTDVVPWVGLAFGAALLLVGLAAAVGRHVALPTTPPVRLRARRPAMTQVLFGVGYGVASLACTLPVFLVLVGAGATGGSIATLVVFAAYAAGMAVVLMALAVSMVLVRDGLTRWARGLVPHMQQLTGVLLTTAGGYLIYYWLRAGFGSPAAVAADPLVGVVTDFAAWTEARAQAGGLFPLMAVTAVVAITAAVSLRRARQEAHIVRTNQPGTDPVPERASRSGLSHIGLLLAAGGVTVGLLGGLVGYQLGTNDTDPANAPGLFADAADDPARSATEQEREALRSDGTAAGMSDLTDMGQLQTLFDQQAGSPRVIALLSPTCVTCLRGANWLQEELSQHPAADVQVYAIWFSVLPTDERVQWDDRILVDPRVTHLWDQEQLAGRWFADHGYGDLPVQWDAVFVYGPEAHWEVGNEPSSLIAWDRPIIAHAGKLAEALRPLLGQP